MSEDMQQDAVDCASQALEKYNIEKVRPSDPCLRSDAAAGTQTDLNVVPDILLDRIDVVSVGGAPVYGSDAIAGVVNIILRTKFKGIEASATSGITEEGDNFSYNASGLVGHDILGVILDVAGAVAPDRHAQALEQQAQQREAGSVATASSEQRLHLHARRRAAPSACSTRRSSH